MLILGGRSRLRLVVIAVVFTLAAFVGGLGAASAWYDLRSDQQHPHARNTYRVLIESTQADRNLSSSSTSRDMASKLSGAAGITAATGIILKTVDTRSRAEEPRRPLRVLYVDDAFPDVFAFDVTKQDVSALEASGGLRLTRSAARSFGLVDARNIWIDGRPRPVLGSIDDPAPNGHLQFDAIASSTALPKVSNVTMGDIIQVNDTDAATYVVLAAGRYKEGLERVDAVRNDIMPAFNIKATLQPLRSIRLSPAPESDAAADRFETGRSQDLYAAIALALVAFVGALSCGALLVRAVVEREARVIGILKAVGRTPAMINARLFLELAAVALAAFLVALGLAFLIGPGLFERLDKQIGALLILGVFLLAAMPMLLLVVAVNCLLSARLVAQSIPQLLAGGATAPRRINAEAVFTALQAGLLMIVVFVALFVGSQLDRAMETARRFGDVWRVEVQHPEDAPRLRAGLESYTSVRKVVATSWSPYSAWSFMSPVRLPGQDVQQSVQSGLLWSDDDVTELLGLELIAGTRLSKRDARTCRAIANEALVRGLGVESPAAAVGRTVETLTGQGHFSCVIAGVVADARYRTARLPLSPALHILADPADPNFRQNYFLLSGSHDLNAARLQARLGEPDGAALPRQLKALERQAYQAERRLLHTLALAAGLIFLSVAATFASAVALAVEEKVIEIGIRRTLGFSWWRIGLVLMRPLALSAAFGIVLALPLATLAAMSWSSGLQQPVSVRLTDLLICACIVLAPLAIALGLNWRHLSSVSPAEVLRS